MTVLELIAAAYRKFNAVASGETVPDDMAADALETFNLLLEDFENDGNIALTEQQTFTVTASTYSYAIGSGQTWNGNKPLRILEAYITINSNDYPITEIYEKEYMRIADKDIEAYPRSFCYVPGAATGTVYLYPSPSTSGTITILNSKPFTQYTALTTTVTLPAGYKSAFIWALAAELYPEFEKSDAPMWLVNQAKKKLDAIKKTNTKRSIPLKYDPILLGNARSFNINTGS